VGRSAIPETAAGSRLRRAMMFGARFTCTAGVFAAATRDILRAIMCRSPLCHAVITARRTEFGCRFSSSGVMSSRVLPSVQWRACSRALSARMTTTQRPILCHLCHCATWFSWHASAALENFVCYPQKTFSTASGQDRKSSRRANFFRFTLNRGSLSNAGLPCVLPSNHLDSIKT
jgi:hypothetical protein